MQHCYFLCTTLPWYVALFQGCLMLLALQLTFLFIVGTALADQAFQRFFSPHMVHGTPPTRRLYTARTLPLHGALQTCVVFLITRDVGLGIGAAFNSALIDWESMKGRLGPRQEDFLHLTCKLIYVFVILGTPELRDKLPFGTR